MRFVAATTRSVDVKRLRTADALELLLLERAKDLGLEREWQIADLVEEQRAAMGQLESSWLALRGARERALFVAEQLAFEQRLGDRRAIDRDERSVGARAQRVQRSGEEFFPSSALTLEEDGRIRRGRAMELL